MAERTAEGIEALEFETFAREVGALSSRVTIGQLRPEARADGDVAEVALRSLLGAHPGHTAQLIAEEARDQG